MAGTFYVLDVRCRDKAAGIFVLVTTDPLQTFALQSAASYSVSTLQFARRVWAV